LQEISSRHRPKRRKASSKASGRNHVIIRWSRIKCEAKEFAPFPVEEKKKRSSRKWKTFN
jgi:hypothetical protein